MMIIYSVLFLWYVNSHINQYVRGKKWYGPYHLIGLTWCIFYAFLNHYYNKLGLTPEGTCSIRKDKFGTLAVILGVLILIFVVYTLKAINDKLPLITKDKKDLKEQIKRSFVRFIEWYFGTGFLIAILMFI
jgi:hypothetical protein